VGNLEPPLFFYQGNQEKKDVKQKLGKCIKKGGKEG